MGEERRARTSRQTILQMVVIGLIASALGVAAGLAIDWFPVQGSTQAKKIDDLWDVLLITSIPVFVLVTTVVLFAVKEFRMRPGEEHLDGPSIHGNTRLEIVWTAIPAVLLVSLCTYAYIVLHDIEKAPARAAGPEMHVDVYGQQFTWTFRYKSPDGKPVNSAQLYLPIDRSVKFDVHSKDVLHDFWVPAFRLKIDAVPGITTHYRVTPDRIGNYPIVCAELCGLGHAFMRQTAHVMTKAQFDAWLAKQSAPAGGGAAGGGAAPAIDAKALFTKGNDNGATACGSCHKLADAGTAGGVGPPLDTAIKTWTPAQIKEAIVNPNKAIAPGFPANVMPPNFAQTLSPQELDALVQYLVKVTHK
jgi:cytochrome c oxidase subunit 2